MIEIRNLTKIYKKQTVLNDVNLRLEMGKIYGLVGVNGSGKTTLMRCIAGFAKPTMGKVVVDGCIVGKDIDFPDKMGVIIENPGFLPSYNAFFNLKILSRVSGKAADEHIRKVITEMGLDPDNLKPVGQYSLGMRGRLGIAQAIMENPDYLILDEPTRGIDIGTKTEIQKLVLDLADQGMAVTFISSEIEEMLRTCSRMGVLRDGKKVGEISGEQLTQEGIMKAIAGGGDNE